MHGQLDHEILFRTVFGYGIFNYISPVMLHIFLYIHEHGKQALLFSIIGDSGEHVDSITAGNLLVCSVACFKFKILYSYIIRIHYNDSSFGFHSLKWYLSKKRLKFLYLCLLKFLHSYSHCLWVVINPKIPAYCVVYH
jgi:hypothetical protein